MLKAIIIGLQTCVMGPKNVACLVVVVDTVAASLKLALLELAIRNFVKSVGT